MGDQVLAEQTTTRRVKPVLALALSDGSTLRATSNHLFYVDGGVGLVGAGWLQAGQLTAGDRLRTARGQDVTVVALHWNVGEAHVYTLTVATDHDFWDESGPTSGDHDFFVGSARVLVHNSNGPCVEVVGDIRKFSEYALLKDKAPVFASAGYTVDDAQELLDLYLTQAREKFAVGDYTELAPISYGRRYTIVIDVPGKGDAAGKVFRFKSGWIVEEDGKLKLTTPFSGNAE